MSSPKPPLPSPPTVGDRPPSPLPLPWWERIRHRWRSEAKPPLARLGILAIATFCLVVALDWLVVTLSPVSESLLLPPLYSSLNSGQAPMPTTVEEMITPDTPLLGRLLTQRERQKILALLGQPTDFPGGFVAGPELPQIILHDTAGELSREELEARPKYTETPLGDGIAAYIPREGQPIFTRPVLFTPFRPTATAYEKGLDFAEESQRDRQLRQVWQATKPPAREQAIQAVVNQLDNPPKDLGKRAAFWFNAGSDRAFRAQYARSPKALDGGKTTAIWAIAQLCNGVLNDPKTLNQAAIGDPQTLQKACSLVNPQLQASQQRLARSFNVELVQKEGSDCFVSTAEVQAFNRIADPAHKIAQGQAVPLASYDREAYTPSQYEGLVQMYLWGAIYAGRYPELVTHYWLDQGNGKAIGYHCDPRGLDLNRVYREIAAVLDHPADTQYGAPPNYGRDPASGDNVWWADNIMGSPAPESL